MITEDYCSYEISRLLEEKGFDIPCKYAWHGGIKKPDFHRHSINFNGGDYKDLRTKWYSAPTHQMAMKWLRKKHNIIIVIEPHFYNPMEEKVSSYVFSIWCGDNYENPLTVDYPTFEEAVEAALKYCLTKLI